VSNENFRRELNAAIDQITGSPSAGLRDRVRSSIGQAPARGGPYWIAAVAAVVIVAVLISALVLANPLRRPTAPVVGGQPSPTASPSSTPTAQLPAFVCGSPNDFVAKGSTPTVAYIGALRTGTHGSYDRITIEFTNGIPGDVQVGAPGGTTFTLSPSGQTVTLKGDHGILITFHGADLHTSYSGSIDIVTGYGTLVEVRRVQDFEGVVQLGLGVKGAGCYRGFFLTNPDRLVIDVQAGS
jgi:hypothetical protein